MGIKVFITGSPEISDYNAVAKAIAASGYQISEIVVSDPPYGGVEFVAAVYASLNGIPLSRIPLVVEDGRRQFFRRNRAVSYKTGGLIALTVEKFDKVVHDLVTQFETNRKNRKVWWGVYRGDRLKWYDSDNKCWKVGNRPAGYNVYNNPKAEDYEYDSIRSGGGLSRTESISIRGAGDIGADKDKKREDLHSQVELI